MVKNKRGKRFPYHIPSSARQHFQFFFLNDKTAERIGAEFYELILFYFSPSLFVFVKKKKKKFPWRLCSAETCKSIFPKRNAVFATEAGLHRLRATGARDRDKLSESSRAAFKAKYISPRVFKYVRKI